MKNQIERRLYVAATNQNDGKTTCSLGFVKGFGKLSKSVGFMKPIGQRYIRVGDRTINEDVLLVHQACGIDCPLKDMNPVAVTSQFTREFIENPSKIYPLLEQRIKDSYEVAAKDNDLVVVEGSGHAGVGSVFNLSNARVARLLDAKAVIITLGGIGRPVDEVAMNLSLFEKEGVEVVGVVVNKVLPEKLEQTRYYLSKAFAGHGLDLLGVIPYAPRLSWPSVQQVAESIQAEVLNGEDRLANCIADIMIGAMTAYNALQYVQDKTLLVVPGDRDDIIFAVVTTDLLRKDIELAGIVLTGGLRPQTSTMDLVVRTGIPVLATDENTYEVASRIHDTTVKMRTSDEEKTRLAASLVHDHVDLEALWERLA